MAIVLGSLELSPKRGTLNGPSQTVIGDLHPPTVGQKTFKIDLYILSCFFVIINVKFLKWPLTHSGPSSFVHLLQQDRPNQSKWWIDMSSVIAVVCGCIISSCGSQLGYYMIIYYTFSPLCPLSKMSGYFASPFCTPCIITLKSPLDCVVLSFGGSSSSLLYNICQAPYLRGLCLLANTKLLAHTLCNRGNICSMGMVFFEFSFISSKLGEIPPKP